MLNPQNESQLSICCNVLHAQHNINQLPRVHTMRLCAALCPPARFPFSNCNFFSLVLHICNSLAGMNWTSQQRYLSIGKPEVSFSSHNDWLSFWMNVIFYLGKSIRNLSFNQNHPSNSIKCGKFEMHMKPWPNFFAEAAKCSAIAKVFLPTKKKKTKRKKCPQK